MILTLLSKELKFILHSLSGVMFVVIYLIINGCLLWLIPGDYNIPENGYASLASFFAISPVLFMLLIPALSMRSFAEEKRMKTLSLLFTRPIHLSTIVVSKVLAVFITACIALIPTIVYVVSLYFLSIPVGNLDLGAIAGSYLGLLFVLCSFVFISVFSSSLTSNQVVAFITGLLLCMGFYFGFDLISGLFSSGKSQLFVRNLGFLYHYKSIQRGLIDSRDICYLILVACIFFFLTIYSLKQHIKLKSLFFGLTVLIIVFICSYLFQYRLDLTAQKRYTISNSTKNLLQKMDAPIEVDLYLNGNLNAGFLRLQQAAIYLLNDFTDISHGEIKINKIDPLQFNDDKFIQKANESGIRGVAVNEKNIDGKISQQVVFPWAVIKSGNTEIPVSLLSNIKGYSGEENLNISIEMLEYQFARAIQLLTQDKVRKIAFLQGHGELTNDTNAADIVDMLSYYYQIDEGFLSAETGQLNDYELLIVAGPQQAFSETEKYVLDQYLMQGGKILWFVDGVKIEPDLLVEKGETPSMSNDVNINDMLFTYGVRIDPVLLQDIQCSEIRINTVSKAADSAYVALPWYYAPLLSPNFDNPVTKGIIPVKSQFASVLSFVDGKNENIKKQVLLSSSEYAHLVAVPEMVSLHEVDRKPDAAYFNQKYLPVAALLEGTFTSVFRNRVAPKDIITNGQPFLSSSKPTRMIVVASRAIIQNEVMEDGHGGLKKLPAGFDPYSGTQYGNREFILNAVNYLTDDDGLMLLRNKTHKMYLLDKQKVYHLHTALIISNIVIPALLPVLLFLILWSIRKKKYKSWS